MYVDDAYATQVAYQAEAMLTLVDIGYSPQEAIESVHLLAGLAFHVESKYIAVEILTRRGQMEE